APCRSVAAEDIRGLQRRTRQERRALRGRPHRRDKMLERARDLAERLEGDAGIERRRVELLMSEQHLDHANVGLLLEQMRGKAMPQRVQGYRLVDLGHQRRGMAGAVELACRERVDPVLPGKQPALWPRFLPPGPQQIEEIPREHDIAVLVALALLDP